MTNLFKEILENYEVEFNFTNGIDGKYWDENGNQHNISITIEYLIIDNSQHEILNYDEYKQIAIMIGDYHTKLALSKVNSNYHK